MTTARRPPAHQSTFGNGTPYLRWGSGERTLLFLQGGPGGAPPSPRSLRWFGGMYRPYVDAGYSLFVVSRRRDMPQGHTIPDMADDLATVVHDEFDGRVDAVVGLSYGGLVAQYLAANHPTCVDAVVLLGAACRLSEWVQDVDHRMAVAAAGGDRAAVGAAVAEYVVASSRLAWLRRLIAPVLGRFVLAEMARDVSPGDLLVEGEAELVFDSRPVLARITAPVLIIAGSRDRAFPPEFVTETAALIPRCTTISYTGRGHLGTAMDRRAARDVLAFLAAVGQRQRAAATVEAVHPPRQR